ncbi:MAG: 50S ribosomal protein L29 [bacterium]
MKPLQLKKFTNEKLQERLLNLEKEVLNTKFDIKIGEIKDFTIVRKKRKEIARIKTILNDPLKPQIIEKPGEEIKEKAAKKAE